MQVLDQYQRLLQDYTVPKANIYQYLMLMSICRRSGRLPQRVVTILKRLRQARPTQTTPDLARAQRGEMILQHLSNHVQMVSQCLLTGQYVFGYNRFVVDIHWLMECSQLSKLICLFSSPNYFDAVNCCVSVQLFYNTIIDENIYCHR